MSGVRRQAVRLKVGVCDRAAVRLSPGYGSCRWTSRFPSPFPPGLMDNSQSLGEQNKAGPSCSLLLLPSGGVERHHRRILMVKPGQETVRELWHL